MKIHFSRADIMMEFNKYDRSEPMTRYQADQFPTRPLSQLLWCSDLHETELIRKDRFATREPGFPGATRYFEHEEEGSPGFQEFCNWVARRSRR